MIEVSNTTDTTLQPGQALTFNTVLLKTGCAECHRPNSGIVRLCKVGIYEVSFSGNITSSSTGAAQIAINLDGGPLTETTMVSTVATANDFENVATATLVRTSPACCGQITVTNTGTIPVTIQANAPLIVKRLA